MNRPHYTLSYEEPEKKEMLSAADEKKYGFHAPSKITSLSSIELDDHLPALP